MSLKDIVKDIHKIEDKVLESVKHVNGVLELLEYTEEDKTPAIRLNGCHALRRVFTKLAASGTTVLPPKDASDKKSVAQRQVSSWLHAQFRVFIDRTALLILENDIKVQLPAMRTLMHFVRHFADVVATSLPTAAAKPGSRKRQRTDGEAGITRRLIFGTEVLDALVSSLLALPRWSKRLAAAFASEFGSAFADVAYHTLRAVKRAAAKRRGHSTASEIDSRLASAPDTVVSRNGFLLLAALPPPTPATAALPLLLPAPGPSKAPASKKQRAASLARAAARNADDADDADTAAERGDAAPAVRRSIIGGADWDPEAEAKAAAASALRKHGPGTGAKAASAGSRGEDLGANSALFAHKAARKVLSAAATSAARQHDAERVSESARSEAGQRRAFTDGWLAYLRLPHDAAGCKRVLGVLHDRVLPFLATPLQLASFLTAAYDQGDAVALLALNGLFVLMSRHNLDYPTFYPKLYALLHPRVLHADHRPRFFRLLALFLASSHLPVYLVAAFVKKLLRLALFAPPPAIMFVIPCAYNLIKRHPECMLLLRRGSNSDRMQKLLARCSRSASEQAAAVSEAEAAELRAKGLLPTGAVAADGGDSDVGADGEDDATSTGSGDAGEAGQDEEEEEEEEVEVVEAPAVAEAQAGDAPDAVGDAAAKPARPGGETMVQLALRLKAEREAAAAAAAAAESESAERSLRGAREFGAKASRAAFEGADPFDAETTDPAQCRALESSLWEAAMLRTHYDPTVSKLARVLEQRMDRQKYVLEDFAAHTYGTMLDDAFARKRKAAPALRVYAPVTLFGCMEDSLPAMERGGKALADGAGVDIEGVERHDFAGAASARLPVDDADIFDFGL